MKNYRIIKDGNGRYFVQEEHKGNWTSVNMTGYPRLTQAQDVKKQMVNAQIFEVVE